MQRKHRIEMMEIRSKRGMELLKEALASLSLLDSKPFLFRYPGPYLTYDFFEHFIHVPVHLGAGFVEGTPPLLAQARHYKATDLPFADQVRLRADDNYG